MGQCTTTNTSRPHLIYITQAGALSYKSTGLEKKSHIPMFFFSGSEPHTPFSSPAAAETNESCTHQTLFLDFPGVWDRDATLSTDSHHN